MTKNVD